MDKKTQQRLAQRSAPRPKYQQHAITRNAQDGPVNINYGHDGNMQFMVFTRPTDHIAFTPEQVDACVAALLEGKEKLAEHKAAGGTITTPGSDRAS